MATHLVTGAGSGIGAALADALHERGDDLVLLARIERAGRRPAPTASRARDVLVADLADPERGRAVGRPAARPARLACVHAAGVVELGPGRRARDSAPGSEQLDVNLIAPADADPGAAAGAAGRARHGRVRELRRRA